MACRWSAWPPPAPRAISAKQSGNTSPPTGSRVTWTASARAKSRWRNCPECLRPCSQAARSAARWSPCNSLRRHLAGLQSVHVHGENLMARILIVDDSPSQLMGIRRIVEKLGHEALTAEDGAAGVEVCTRELPDLVLMDVVMPNLNGFQATRSISKNPATQHIPVILVTTKDQDTDRVWGMRQGAKAYITKPFSESDLADMIQQMLGGEAPAAPEASEE